MNAKQLMEQVAALPPSERLLFEQLFRTMEARTLKAPAPTSSALPDFGQRMRAIYGNKIVPDSQLIIDEERADR